MTKKEFIQIVIQIIKTGSCIPIQMVCLECPVYSYCIKVADGPVKAAKKYIKELI